MNHQELSNPECVVRCRTIFIGAALFLISIVLTGCGQGDDSDEMVDANSGLPEQQLPDVQQPPPAGLPEPESETETDPATDTESEPESVTPLPGFPVGLFFDRLRTQGARYEMRGQFDNGGVVSVQRHVIQRTALAPVSVPWQGRTGLKRNLIKVERFFNGQPWRNDHYARYFDSNDVFVGEQAKDEINYWLSDPLNRPEFAQIGESGSLATQQLMREPDQYFRTNHLYWRVERGDDSTARYCETTIERNSAGAVYGSFEWCYGLTANADPTGYISFNYEYGANTGSLQSNDLKFGAAPLEEGDPNDGDVLPALPAQLEPVAMTLDCQVYDGSGSRDGRYERLFYPATGKLTEIRSVYNPAAQAYEPGEVLLMDGGFRWDALQREFVSAFSQLSEGGIRVQREAAFDSAHQLSRYQASSRSDTRLNRSEDCFDGVLERPNLPSPGPVNTLRCVTTFRPTGEVRRDETKEFWFEDGYLIINGIQGDDIFVGTPASTPVSSTRNSMQENSDGSVTWSQYYGAKGAGSSQEEVTFQPDALVTFYRTYSSFSIEVTRCLPAAQ